MKARRLILDASVTAVWLLPDEASDVSRRAYAQLRKGMFDVRVPQLWLWECGNIIANAVKRSRLSAPDALLTWSVLDAIRARVEMSDYKPSQVQAALQIALDHSLSIYDAAYLWLAFTTGLPLLTHDRLMSAAAARLSLPVLRLEDIA